jgi:hypothetical protein
MFISSNLYLPFYLKGGDSVAHDLIYGPTKQNLKGLKSKSVEAITFGDPSTWDKPFVSYTSIFN